MARKRRSIDPVEQIDTHPAVRGRQWRPKNQAQQDCWDTIDANTITFILGPAGTAKSHTAVAYALEMARKGEYDRVVLTRPLTTSTEEIGTLPGSVAERVGPFHRALTDIAEKVDKQIEIEMIPLALIRGLTFDDAVCILDEAQNLTREQCKLYLSRLGHGSKMIICADLEQSDIRNSGLHHTISALRDIPEIAMFEFGPQDIVRSPLIRAILERLR